MRDKKGELWNVERGNVRTETRGFASERLSNSEMPSVDGSYVRRYLTFVKTTISTKGQIVVPAEFRQRDDIEAGEEFEVERIDRGEYRLIRLAPPPNDGLVKWLLRCPEKGYFVPVEGESTDTL